VQPSSKPFCFSANLLDFRFILQKFTPAQLEILEKLYAAPLETDEDLTALGEIFGEDE
jgi:hypothetical protein